MKILDILAYPIEKFTVESRGDFEKMLKPIFFLSIGIFTAITERHIFPSLEKDLSDDYVWKVVFKSPDQIEPHWWVVTLTSCTILSSSALFCKTLLERFR
ncbi:MAG: hypothetical protein KR126chlam6_01477 [Candidatus Anoxychlamydiales bacterium]|nr:hypothetical protein [Candidatus Anoxychlamydiales bacterium]